jgi:hypothetical protein
MDKNHLKELILLNSPRRVCTECLIEPALRNIPLEAQPWAKETMTTINKLLFKEETSPTIIKVMCVILL